MGSHSDPAPQWWDREVDDQGTLLRSDVRSAAKEFWPDACRRARDMVDDDCDAAELLEASVAHVSRDLDHGKATPSIQHASSLLSLRFAQELGLLAAKLGRVQKHQRRQKTFDAQIDGRDNAAETIAGWAEDSGNAGPSLPEMSGCWLDRGCVEGVGPRDDVRSAAVAVWVVACGMTRAATNDPTETAALMEAAVVKASEYLDRIRQEASIGRAGAVLLKIFSRKLMRKADQLDRLRSAGHEIEMKAAVESWEAEVNRAIFRQQLERHLSQEGVTIMSLRLDGHGWDAIAIMFGTTVTAIRKRFWREIEYAKIKLGIGPQEGSGGGGKPRKA